VDSFDPSSKHGKRKFLKKDATPSIYGFPASKNSPPRQSRPYLM